MAATLARWQGGVDETLRDHGRRLDAGDRRDDAQDRRIGKLEVSQGRLRLGMGIAGAVGSALGGAIVPTIVYLLTH